ncbi:MAG: ArsR family transcriptional regulator [Lachnospiraceae bacterium]|nr:ArsR family transcriptional regulator [Robinsoniella sp.]MDY3767177.1 ArsR family transcriptional regulator [Lachnospiraceae bacterium]
MLYVKHLKEGVKLFKALGSEVRVEIIQLLLEKKEMNMNEIASSLGITNGALTSHIKKMEECGLVKIMTDSQGHGNEKKCRVNVDRILIDVEPVDAEDERNIYNVNVPIGHFSDYSVFPTCGLATEHELIGTVDDPRYFAYPERINAKIIWFTRGYIEYIIPNLLPASQKIDQITLSFEISSEAPGVNSDWPSDITFFLNDTEIGTWTSPGDYGDVKGIFTPDWWFPNWNQYGLLKMLVINKKGTFLDGLKISDITSDYFELNYKSMIRFKMMVKDDARNVGGLTIFGKEFGNYNQDIQVRINYSPM